MKKFLQFLSPLLGLALLGVALWVLSKELGQYEFEDVLKRVKSIPEQSIFESCIVAVFSYLVLTSYDYFGLIFAKVRLPYRKIALASFISYSLSHNLGFALVTGGAARLRMLTRWGINATDVAKQVAFVSLMFTLGYGLIAGVVFLFLPPTSPYISPHGLRITGLCLLTAVSAFFITAFVRRKPITISGITIPRVPCRLTSFATVVAAFDWAVAASVAYLLFPKGSIEFPAFLGVFLVAQIIGLISHVPGGIGVFEGVMVSALSGRMSADKVLGCLLVYRLVYYIGPFLIALLTYCAYEAYAVRGQVKRIAQLLMRPSAVMMPAFTTITVFGAGLILLFSSATPPAKHRFNTLLQYLPLGLIETFHILGSVLGVGLLIVAHGLWRRVDGAYFTTIGLLVGGILTCLLKGFDVEEALILLGILILFVPSRQFFFRKASLWKEVLSPRWTFLLIGALIGTFWTVFFFYKHVEYSHELWWQFAKNAHVSRSMRATFCGTLLATFWLGIKAFSPLPPPFKPPTGEELELVKRVVETSHETSANLALLGDKEILFNADQTGFVMFALEGRSCVAMGDPVGPALAQEELIWDFYELCQQHAKNAVFYEVSERNLGTYVEVGLSLLKLGEEAQVSLPDFHLDGKARSALRQGRNKILRAGYTFEIVETPHSPELLRRLEEISAQWLANKSTREKGFSLGFFAIDYIAQFPIALVRKENEIVAFANIWKGAAHTELSVDLMRYVADAPNGLMDFLFTELILWGQAQGYAFFNLGMAPFSGFEDRDFAPFWTRLGAMIFQHGEHFYNFKGLRNYKDKFFPQWRSKYLVYPGRLSLPIVLSNTTTLISGGVKGVFSR